MEQDQPGRTQRLPERAVGCPGDSNANAKAKAKGNRKVGCKVDGLPGFRCRCRRSVVAVSTPSASAAILTAATATATATATAAADEVEVSQGAFDLAADLIKLSWDSRRVHKPGKPCCNGGRPGHREGAVGQHQGQGMQPVADRA